MDGRTSVAVACAVAGSAWALLGVAIVARRVRFARSTRVPAEPAPVLLPPERAADYGWASDDWADDPVLGPAEVGRIADADAVEAGALLARALRSREPAVRRAAVAALGRLGDRHDWAVDGLIEALVEGRDTPARVAAELDRLAARVGARIVPLLGHPSSVVRFYAVRLLARHGDVGRRLASALVADPSANVRAAALETLRTVATGDALRSALRSLDDPHPHVRAHACRTACSISGTTAAPFVVPLLGDDSWWVRDAARKALVSSGGAVVSTVVPALGHEDANVRRGAALVLQDVGVVDELVSGGMDPGLLQRIFDAGGERLRAATAERARRGHAVLRETRPLHSGAGP
jgi:hypothetical protein